MKSQNIAIAALFGYVSLQTETAFAQIYVDGEYQIDTFEGYGIIQGWLGGSNTLNNLQDPPTCFSEVDDLNMFAQAIYDGLTYDGITGDFNDIFQVTDLMSAMLQVFRDSEEDCKIMGENWNWDRIDQIIEAWQKPLGYAYHKDKDIMINGRDVMPFLKQAVSNFEYRQFYDFGNSLGRASAEVLDGYLDIQSGKVPNGGPPSGIGGSGDDPKLQWAMKMGSQFATGFLYGARVGGFDDVEIYNCLTKETDSDEFFLGADVMLKQALNDNDPYMAIKGLGNMFKFITLMVMEQEDEPGKINCPMLAYDQDSFTDVHAMFELMQDPQTNFKFVEGGPNVPQDAFMFNNQDITGDVSYIIDSYMKQDFKKMGFLLGEVFDTYLDPNAVSNGQINVQALEEVESQGRMNGDNMFLY